MAIFNSPTTGIILNTTDLASVFPSSQDIGGGAAFWYKFFNIKPEAAVGWYKTGNKDSTTPMFGKKGDMSRTYTPELSRRIATIYQVSSGNYETTYQKIVEKNTDPENRLQDLRCCINYYDRPGNPLQSNAIWTALAGVPLNDAGTTGNMVVGTYYGQFLYNGTTNNISTRQPGFSFTNYSDQATITLQPYVKYRHSDAARQMSFRLLKNGSVIQTQPGTTNAATTTHTFNFSNITIAPNTTDYFRVEGSILTGTGTDYLYLAEFGFNYVSYA